MQGLYTEFLTWFAGYLGLAGALLIGTQLLKKYFGWDAKKPAPGELEPHQSPGTSFEEDSVGAVQTSDRASRSGTGQARSTRDQSTSGDSLQIDLLGDESSLDGNGGFANADSPSQHMAGTSADGSLAVATERLKTIRVFLVFLGVSGGLMWTLTSRPMAWDGLLWGAGIAAVVWVSISLSLVWLASAVKRWAGSPSSVLVDVLDTLSLVWDEADDMRVVVHRTAARFAQREPLLAEELARIADASDPECALTDWLRRLDRSIGSTGRPTHSDPSQQLKQIANRIRDRRHEQSVRSVRGAVARLKWSLLLGVIPGMVFLLLVSAASGVLSKLHVVPVTPVEILPADIPPTESALPMVDETPFPLDLPADSRPPRPDPTRRLPNELPVRPGIGPEETRPGQTPDPERRG